MLKSISNLMSRLNQTAGGLTDSKLVDLVDTIFSRQGRMNRTLVSLTSVATTTLFTVPSGYDFYVTDIVIEGQTAQSGGTSSTLKAGKSGSLILLNDSTGHGFVAATATTLIGAGKRRHMSQLYPLSNMNGSNVVKYTGGDVILADVSGTVLTAGAVYVELYGILVPTGS